MRNVLAVARVGDAVGAVGVYGCCGFEGGLMSLVLLITVWLFLAIVVDGV